MAWREKDGCPFCGTSVSEVGGLACCGAITADCVGTVNGRSAETIDYDEDPAAEERLTRHSWYVDTLQAAPQEWAHGAVGCRCNT